jgi:hypothetical protein
VLIERIREESAAQDGAHSARADPEDPAPR